LPSYVQIMAEMGPAGGLPPFTRLVFASNGVFMIIQILIILFLWFALFLYIGGPRERERVTLLLGGWDVISPWRMKRLSRDFSAMLAVLLDTGVPEAEAVALAGQSTANPTFLRRANQVVSQLKQGVKLPEALRVLDRGGELQWRIANALHRGHGFLKALAGWHDALDAKAFQQEQMAAQLTTTGLVLLNGLIVGSIVCAVFLCLINLINGAVLW
jgi:type II secretory pathway component PulF